ncbi:MAG: hypothetical protein LKJ80_03155 [Oscillibacter sp.]|nr:hypothetical protein [Oscillibacter sp.]
MSVENSAFKSVAFGGFDKQSVISYIEKTAEEHSAALEKLEKENGAFKTDNTALQEQLSALQSQLNQLTEQLAEQAASGSALQTEVEQLQSDNARLRELEPQLNSLRTEADALRPDAEAYRRLRSRLGDIECEARKRAADLEAASNARLSKAVSDFRETYRTLSASLDTASDYMTGELRKLEVNLSQLPRAMDQIGTELQEVEKSLKIEKSE